MTSVWSGRSGHEVGDETREDIPYYHRIAAVRGVSAAFPMPVGIRFPKDGETEVSCMRALWQGLKDE